MVSQGKNVVEDGILVKKILQGDIESFEILIKKYELMVLRFIYGMTKQKETSEDITQEVFITVYNKLEMYNNAYSFSNWILQIAKNKCIDYMRKYNKVQECDIDMAYNISSKDMGPQGYTEYQEVKRKIDDYIKTLDEIDTQILSLRYSKDLTFKDISEILSLTETTVKRRYYKIRDGFKIYYNH